MELLPVWARMPPHTHAMHGVHTSCRAAADPWIRPLPTIMERVTAAEHTAGRLGAAKLAKLAGHFATAGFVTVANLVPDHAVGVTRSERAKFSAAHLLASHSVTCW